MPSEVHFDEIVAALKRSRSPTLIVEGRDDYVAFTDFEIENVQWGLTVLPVKGQGNVEKLIDLRDEINHPALAFLLDRDCAIYDSANSSETSNDTFYTDGYAIENDLIRDGQIVKLLRPEEWSTFSQELEYTARFFACCAFFHVSGCPSFPLSTHPQQILNDDGTVKPDYWKFIENTETVITSNFAKTKADPLRYIKGKVLLQLFTRHLSHQRRRSKFSSANLMELGSVARGPFLTTIEGSVLNFFQSLGVAPVR